ncbi:MAG TPA: hypothetical protein VK158_05345 [Acidobacteriota bacterium]|nr:hypothetical protein [Acidobacteriota bacterium]
MEIIEIIHTIDSIVKHDASLRSFYSRSFMVPSRFIFSYEMNESHSEIYERSLVSNVEWMYGIFPWEPISDRRKVDHSREPVVSFLFGLEGKDVVRFETQQLKSGVIKSGIVKPYDPRFHRIHEKVISYIRRNGDRSCNTFYSSVSGFNEGQVIQFKPIKHFI